GRAPVSDSVVVMKPVELDAPSPGEFPGLEAFFAENRTTLGGLEGDRGLLTAGRACRDGFHSLASDGAGRTTGPLPFARLTALWFVLEVLVGEELLFSRRPNELRTAVNALKDPILELHRSLPRRVGRRSPRAHSSSRRSFLRLRFLARACFALRLSPGFK